jgi:hypothetical protein
MDYDARLSPDNRLLGGDSPGRESKYNDNKYNDINHTNKGDIVYDNKLSVFIINTVMIRLKRLLNKWKKNSDICMKCTNILKFIVRNKIEMGFNWLKINNEMNKKFKKVIKIKLKYLLLNWKFSVLIKKNEKNILKKNYNYLKYKCFSSSVLKIDNKFLNRIFRRFWNIWVNEVEEVKNIGELCIEKNLTFLKNQVWKDIMMIFKSIKINNKLIQKRFLNIFILKLKNRSFLRSQLLYLYFIRLRRDIYRRLCKRRVLKVRAYMQEN